MSVKLDRLGSRRNLGHAHAAIGAATCQSEARELRACSPTEILYEMTTDSNVRQTGVCNAVKYIKLISLRLN